MAQGTEEPGLGENEAVIEATSNAHPNLRNDMSLLYSWKILFTGSERLRHRLELIGQTQSLFLFPIDIQVVSGMRIKIRHRGRNEFDILDD